MGVVAGASVHGDVALTNPRLGAHTLDAAHPRNVLVGRRPEMGTAERLRSGTSGESK